MKKSEIERIEWLCEYKLGGLEREILLAKKNELCEAQAHARAVAAGLKAMLARYE